MIIIDWDFDVPIDTLKLFILAVITGSKTISVFKLLNNRIEQQVARRAHNPKVIGSSPIPATTQDGSVLLLVRFLFASSLPIVNE